MSEHSLPTYRYFRDGRRVVVQTQAEFDALESGHSDSPAGPWPDGRVDDPMGVDWKGPFAPDPVWLQYGYRYGPIRPAPNWVYAQDSLIYPLVGDDRWARCPGECFFLRGLMEDACWLRSGQIMLVPFYASPVMLLEIPRVFLDQPSRDEYSRRYALGDSSWFDAFRGQQGSAPRETVHTPGVKPKKIGRTSRIEKTRELLDFIDILKTVVRDYRRKHEGADPTQEIIAHSWPPPGMHSKTLYNWLNDALPLGGYTTKPVHRALKAWLNDFLDGKNTAHDNR